MPDRFTALSPDQQAVISLLIGRGQTYAGVAAMLGITDEAVRGRAHRALSALAGEPPAGSSAEDVQLIGDYLLGQLAEAERLQTLALLVDDAAARAWAQQAAGELQPHAKVALPAVPDDLPAPAAEPVSRAAVEPARAPARAPRRAPERAPRRAPEQAPRERAPREEAAGTPRPRRPATPGAARPAGRVDRGAAVLAAAGAALIAAIVVFVVAGGGSGNPPVGPIPASAATATTAATTTSTTASGSTGNANVLATLTLSSPTSGSKASGAAEVIQSGSKQVLAFSASGLPSPGSGHYVLWLYSSASKYKPLGEISSVKNGTVSPVGVTLPADASSYTGVVLTLVSASKPSSPGPIVLLGTGTTPL